MISCNVFLIYAPYPFPSHSATSLTILSLISFSSDLSRTSAIQTHLNLPPAHKLARPGFGRDKNRVTEEDKIDGGTETSLIPHLNFISLLKIVFIFPRWPESARNFLWRRSGEEELSLFRASSREKHAQQDQPITATLCQVLRTFTPGPASCLTRQSMRLITYRHGETPRLYSNSSGIRWSKAIPVTGRGGL
jgi:hypothetical protein